jgi:predicted membrane protein
MFNGFARITQGAFDRTQPTRFRAFSIGIGALSIGASIFVANSEMFGIIFPIRVLFIVLLIYGIGILIVYGVTGKLLSLDEILKKKIRSREMNNTPITP